MFTDNGLLKSCFSQNYSLVFISEHEQNWVVLKFKFNDHETTIDNYNYFNKYYSNHSMFIDCHDIPYYLPIYEIVIKHDNELYIVFEKDMNGTIERHLKNNDSYLIKLQNNVRKTIKR